MVRWEYISRRSLAGRARRRAGGVRAEPVKVVVQVVEDMFI
jgi:hypothetical protein